MQTEMKKIDSQGRVALPVKWRSKVKKDGKVIVVALEDRVEIFPANQDLSKYINSVKIDVKNWVDWHALKEELLGIEKS